MSHSFDLHHFIGETVNIKRLIEKVSFDSSDVGSAAQDQPKLYLEASRFYVQKVKAVNRAKAELAELKAALGRKLRRKLGESGLRVTEAMVVEALSRKRAFVHAERALDRATELEVYAKLMLEAFKMRRDEIGNMISLQRAEGNYQMSLEGEREIDKLKKKLDRRYPGK